MIEEQLLTAIGNVYDDMLLQAYDSMSGEDAKSAEKKRKVTFFSIVLLAAIVALIVIVRPLNTKKDNTFLYDPFANHYLIEPGVTSGENNADVGEKASGLSGNLGIIYLIESASSEKLYICKDGLIPFSKCVQKTIYEKDSTVCVVFLAEGITKSVNDECNTDDKFWCVRITDGQNAISAWCTQNDKELLDDWVLYVVDNGLHSALDYKTK